MTPTFRIAAIPGDGIGNEVLPEGLRVLNAAADRFGFALDVGMEYEKVFGADDASRAMRGEAVSRIRSARPAKPSGPSTLARAKSLVPAPAKRLIKKIIR